MLALFACSPNHFLQIRVQFLSYTIVSGELKEARSFVFKTYPKIVFISVSFKISNKKLTFGVHVFTQFSVAVENILNQNVPV